MDEEYAKESLPYIVNHVFMPPRVPQEDEQATGIYDKDHALCAVALESTVKFFKHMQATHAEEGATIVKMLQHFTDLNGPRAFEPEELAKKLEGMTVGDVIPMFIRKQNAGLILRMREDVVIVETFEVSSRNQDVLASTGPLIRTFPGPSVAFPSGELGNAAFRTEFALFVAQMNADTLEGSSAHIFKAGSRVVEVRDTSHPRYITELLVGILGAFSLATSATTNAITKRVADDVLWKDCLLPWRRSPVWLVLRVALQTSIDRTENFRLYKSLLTFIMSGILRQSAAANFSSDILSYMRTKLSRRAAKLDDKLHGFVAADVGSALDYIKIVLQERWQNIQQREERELSNVDWKPDRLEFNKDTRLSLLNSRSYLKEAMDRTMGEQSNHSSDVVHPPELHRPILQMDFYGVMQTTFPASPEELHLADFEHQVQRGADKWASDISISRTPNATRIIVSAMSHYWEAGRACYQNNAEGHSILLLTLAELWRLLDRIVLVQLPMLGRYPPEVPLSILEPLLLRRSADIERLKTIVTYIRNRQLQASGPSVYGTPVQNSFPVQYFNASPELRQLKASIEATATSKRAAKQTELTQLNAKYYQLVEQASRLAHHPACYGNNTHGSCHKCRLTFNYERMTITLHEWPLPADELLAKAIVTELRCPAPYSSWRDGTYFLIHDVCTHPSRWTQNVPKIRGNILGYMTEQQGVGNSHTTVPRVTFGSSKKTFKKSHYRRTQIPETSVNRVYVKNAGDWRLCDLQRELWVENIADGVDVERRCTLILPESTLYRGLQYAMSTKQTMNEVLLHAKTKCSPDLNPLEYIAFGSLRAGGRIQWLNIARELSADSLTFSSVFVHLLCVQAAFQVGPFLSPRFDWHEELQNNRFCELMLRRMEAIHANISDNWMELTTMRTLIVLTTRILVFNTFHVVKSKCVALLRAVRGTIFGWLNRAIATLETTLDHSVASGHVERRICELAVSCRLTFAFDAFDDRSLLAEADGAAILIRCQMAIADFRPSDQHDDGDFELLLWRDRQISRELSDELADHIQQDPRGINTAVTAVWSSYRSSGVWTRLPDSRSHWMYARTEATSQQRSQTVHFNLLTGQLLVDGKSLSRLPANIVEHSTFKAVFDTQNFAVIPSDVPGMQYVTRSPYSGNNIFFGLFGEYLAIHAQPERKLYPQELLEIVPANVFNGDLPQTLVQDHVFWLDAAAQSIQVRPKTEMWVKESSPWLLAYGRYGSSWTIGTKHGEYLMDKRSPSFRMIAAIFDNFEHPDFLVVSWYQRTRVQITLPRYRLKFFLNDKLQIQSYNIPNMIVDLDQSIGTLYGLMNRLVLQESYDHLGKPLQTRSRRVLIPIGDVKIAQKDAHVMVSIDSGVSGNKRITYHDYLMDTELQTLTGNATLESRLYKILLHAMTSYCLPDPFTSRLGLDVSLEELMSAGCTSFQALRSEAIKLLQVIRRLTPRHTYYPENMRMLHSVDWSENMSLISQNSAFEPRIHEIMSYAQQLSMFEEHADSETPKTFRPIDWLSPPELIARSRDVHTLSAPRLASAGSHYRSRADAQLTGEESYHRVARAILHQDFSKSGLDAAEPKLSQLYSEWGTLLGSGLAVVSTSYSRQWLEADFLNGNVWLSMIEACRQEGEKETPSMPLLFSLSSVAFDQQKTAFSLLPYLLAFAILPSFSLLSPPRQPSYHPGVGITLEEEKVREIICKHSPSTILDGDVSWLSEKLLRAPHDWTNQLLSIDGRMLLNRRQQNLIGQEVLALRQHQADNRQLFYHIHSVETALKVEIDHISVLEQPVPVEEEKEFAPSAIDEDISQHRRKGRPTILDIMRECTPPATTFTYQSDQEVVHDIAPSLHLQSTVVDLESLVSEFCSSKQTLYAAYGMELEASVGTLNQDTQSTARNSSATESRFDLDNPEALRDLRRILRTHLDRHTLEFNELLSRVQASLSPKTLSEKLLYRGGAWPQITFRQLLTTMSRRGGWADLAFEWKRVLVHLAFSAILRQRARRMLRLSLLNSNLELEVELKNPGIFDEDMAITHPDWLLIQIENDFLARPLQIQMAIEMFHPSSNRNTVMQLNMGEGKSSIIIPMVAASLSDGEKLARVIVLKSLSQEMFQLLVQRLSGLLNRRICYFPFSRETRLGPQELHQLEHLYKACVLDGGILVVQPEHVLSAKLLLVDKLLPISKTAQAQADSSLATSMSLHRWLSAHARDILDESDELLHVRYQLIYTKGTQRPIEGQPYRWQAIQSVLSIVAARASTSAEESVDVLKEEAWSFPHLRFSANESTAYFSRLVNVIADDIVEHDGIPSLNASSLDKREQGMLRSFLMSETLSSDRDELQKLFDDGSNTTWNMVLLLRGLLGHGLITYVLRDKRWRVDYGLDESRSMLAVPFRAKDVPSPRAEFGHPDVAILLTCLAYYYHGLSTAQVTSCIRRLLRLRNPGAVYSIWTQSISAQNLPESIQSFRGLNIEDSEQFNGTVYPLFRRNVGVINFYLSNTVFPSSCKEFPSKLQSSGWDLAEERTNFTTGFSGTNDNRYLLPTSMTQEDPVGQGGTNALVLTHLLRPENAHYRCTRTDEGGQMTGKELVALIAKLDPQAPVRVLLDVGAQMLDMQNLDLAQYWLSRTSAFSIDAAIFFNSADQLTVLSRDGTIEPFVSSPLRQTLWRCIVYLDDAHTRGTDLKLPPRSRAAVTLGPKVTKDRLVQGCMRMRRLGRDHSILFCAPPAVDHGIRQAGNLPANAQICVVDILRWAMRETLSDFVHHAPHWAQQGLDFMARRDAILSIGEDPSDGDIARMKAAWLQPEARTIAEMYDTIGRHTAGKSHPALEHPELSARIQMLGLKEMPEVNLDEEQERAFEVSHEIEEEPDVERARKPVPCTPSVHIDVRALVESGVLRQGSTSILNAFRTLQGVRYQRDLAGDFHACSLLVTRDFSQTVTGVGMAEFLAPVQWILSLSKEAGQQRTLLVMSQYEVNELLPLIRHSKHVRLHLYCPRTSISSEIFDHLQFFCIPPLPKTSERLHPSVTAPLNMFAGQLYPSSHVEYRLLCYFLGLSPDWQQHFRRRDRFVSPANRQGGLKASPFSTSPVRFFKELIALRRKGQEFDTTPLGRILNGMRLSESEFNW